MTLSRRTEDIRVLRVLGGALCDLLVLVELHCQHRIQQHPHHLPSPIARALEGTLRT